MNKFKSLLQEGVEIGVANTKPAVDGEILSIEELSDMVLTRGYHGIKPYIAKGHDGLWGDGAEPQWGTVDPSTIRFDSKSGILYVTPDFVSEELIQEIEEGKFQKLSIEYSKVNYKDIDLFDENNKRLSNYQAFTRYAYGEPVYNEKKKEMNFNDVFKNFLLGFAVLGRKTPAYGEFDLSTRFRSSEGLMFKGIRSSKGLDICKEVIMPVETTNPVVQEENSQIGLLNNDTPPKATSKRNTNVRGLNDGVDDKITMLEKELNVKNSELEYERQQNTQLTTDIKALKETVKSYEDSLCKEQVYNLWLTYRSDGRLTKEEMIADNFDIETKQKAIEMITDPVERQLREREFVKEAVCSGTFFIDYLNASPDIRKSLIRSIERKPKVIEKQDKSKFNTGVDQRNSSETSERDQLYKLTRHLAKKSGIDPDSVEFDLFRWRAEAIREMNKSNIGGFDNE